MQNRKVATSWLKPNVSGLIIPSQRCSHASTLLDKKLYIYGGIGWWE